MIVLEGESEQSTVLTPEAFAERLEGSSLRMWCIAVSVLGERTDAEDVLQDAAIVALGKLDEFDAGTHFDAWMGQIVRYTALNRARKRTRRKTYAADPMSIDASQSSGTDGGQQRGEVVGSAGGLLDGQSVLDDELVGALESLEVNARACFLLRVVTGLTYRDISRAIGITESTATVHVHRVRKALRELLGNEQGGVA